jgi:diguanylate cyclase (GGDEF)-like protein
MKNKILLRIGLMIGALSLGIILIVIFNFRNYGIKTAQEKAEIVAELVKDGLTSHMINGIMDKRDEFLRNTANNKDIEKLWVVRGEKVVKQYGKPMKQELPRDDIDKEVLKTGKKRIVITENFDHAKIRVTIPYVASSNGLINCFACHNADVGDTLGIVSMEFDISSIQSQGFQTVGKIILTTILAIIIVVLVTNKILNPYLELFESLKNSIKKASNGNFDAKIKSNLTDEAGEMVGEYDQLLYKLDNTFGQIDKNLRTLVSIERNKDPLSDAQNIISSLAQLFQFKKAIDLDQNKQDIYNRIEYALVEFFGIKNFAIYEIDHESNESKEVLRVGDIPLCSVEYSKNSDLCRAKRTGKDVSSDDFPELCPCFVGNDDYHLCIPVNIGGRVGIVLHIVCKEKEGFERIKQNIGFVKSYISEASPALESRRLMEILKESTLKDPMTKLYNRRYLDEYVEILAPQAIRKNIKVGILLIDMDYFKKVNDTYGHDVGDIVLKELSEILVKNVRKSDIVVRFGGEEFVALLYDIKEEGHLLHIAQKIRQEVENKEINIGNSKVLKKTVSIGVSMFPDDVNSFWQCIKFADIALYKAKESGRNKVVRYSKEMKS